jgi:hypothetical protein
MGVFLGRFGWQEVGGGGGIGEGGIGLNKTMNLVN